jgi:succinate dehydrogenase/fumarate reductase-like Fe-S protein
MTDLYPSFNHLLWKRRDQESKEEFYEVLACYMCSYLCNSRKENFISDFLRMMMMMGSWTVVLDG